MSDLNWGIIGCGKIAEVFSNGLKETTKNRCFAVASRSICKAVEFAKKQGAAKAYGSYDELIHDTEVDIVYIATPHPSHAELAINALNAGKHVLCEKPLALSSTEVKSMVEAAQNNGRFLMEAFMYRCHPQTEILIELVKAGEVGDLRIINCSFGFSVGKSINLSDRLFNKELGGGAIWDVGCYPVSMSRLIAGATKGQPFLNPTKVNGSVHFGANSMVDEWAVATLSFEGDLYSQISTSNRVSLKNGLSLFCTEGVIEVKNPWVCDREKPSPCQISVKPSKGNGRLIEFTPSKTTFAIEAEKVYEAIVSGRLESIQMGWNDSIGNIAVLESWIAS